MVGVDRTIVPLRSAHHDHSTENYRTSFSYDLGSGCDMYNLAAHHPIANESWSVGQALNHAGEFALVCFAGLQDFDLLSVDRTVRAQRAFNFDSRPDPKGAVFLINLG